MVASGDAASSFLLAIECASRTASAALMRGAELLGTRTSEPGRHHAETLLSLIASLLAEQDAKPDDLDAFAVGVGPGSFTSIRIGVATIKGLAFESSRPVAQVSTLEAIAHGSFAAHTEVSHVVAVLDARRGQVYAAEFERSLTSETPNLVGVEALCTARSIAETAGRGASVAGELPPLFADALREAGRSDLAVLPASPLPRAVAVASLGREALSAGRWVLSGELSPQYLRRPEAEEMRLAAESLAAGGSSPRLDTLGKL